MTAVDSSAPPPRAQAWRVALLLFGSGCSALIYQTAWMREFRLIFGASTAASAAVLAIFVGGLGLGGLILGPRADRHPRPILYYARLEVIVAVSAALTPFVLTLVQLIYFSLGGTLRLGTAGGTLLRLVLSTVVLAVPTFVMGGTLPAAARGVTRGSDARRQDVATLYALNTLGAVMGCVVSTFYFLEIFGTRQTLWLAAALNMLIVVLARQVDRSSVADVDTAAEAAPIAAAAAPPAPTSFLLIASGVVGFAFFLMELVWYRMLGPLLGGSVFTFGLILAVALVGIGIGGLLYSLIGVNRPASLTGLATSCLLEAAAIALAFALGDRVAILALVLMPLGQAAFGALVAGWTIVAVIVVLPAAIISGYQFPQLIALFGRGRESVGRQIGLAYAANTLGAIAGSLAGGFLVLPLLSTPGAWRFGALCLVALGMAAAILSMTIRSGGDGVDQTVGSRPAGWRPILVPSALAALTVLLLTAVGPTAVWRHSGIASGTAGITTVTSPQELRRWMHAQRSFVEWQADGFESSVALSIGSGGYAFVVNGKADGSARVDAGTQVMLALVGSIVHPDPRRSLVIGLGTGSSAGWLGAVPSMERVDVVELEPIVLEVAKQSRAVNHDVLNNPKVHVRIGDAREVLLTTDERYDLIASEPSNPFRAGIASLFTQEYYLAANDRLTDDGLFLQWLQAYGVDATAVRTVYATMASVFPSVETWQTRGGDIVLVGGKRPPSYDLARIAARVEQEPYRSALRVAWRANGVEGFLGRYLAGDALTRAIAAAPGVSINTDDRNLVEFGFARSLGRDYQIVSQIRGLARAIGATRPPTSRGTVDWAAVEMAWVSQIAAEGGVIQINPHAAAADQARQRALIHYYREDNLEAARAAWMAHSSPPADHNEVAMVADIQASAGAPEAVGTIERLRQFHAGEADVMLAELRFAQRDYEGAAAALESAFAIFRREPWALPRFTQKAVGRAQILGGANPTIARRMIAALSEPFSVKVADHRRRVAVAFLTRQVDFKGLCGEAIGALEPDVPWVGDFLMLRRSCYQETGHQRLAAATRELHEFLAMEGLPLDTGVSATPAQASTAGDGATRSAGPR
jgi:predicted membrane-bound spermidine synthase